MDYSELSVYIKFYDEEAEYLAKIQSGKIKPNSGEYLNSLFGS